ncbi:MAG: SGNH/GDSL hydrolase family protein [Kiritimatiellaeota bacterium]|nr:SGNH/GDSL hydrolase family protein [Kiritimatiellota bacterium]
MMTRIFLRLWLVASCLAGLGNVCGAAEAPTALARLGAAGGGKILFLGNSITRHGPKADIGWTNNFGMAATALEKDYVHVLTAAIAKQLGKQPEMLAASLVDFERGYANYDIAAKTKPFIDFKADLIVLAIGENTPALANAAATTTYKECLVRLLKALKQGSAPVIFVRSCFWANKAKDEALRQASAETGCVFVDIGALGKDEANYARSEQKIKHAGVANHPGDRGMQAIAGALLAALKTQK